MPTRAADRRRAAHQALADVLPDAEADRRAWHLALAALGPDVAVSSALEQAALRARARSAYEVASIAFERSETHAVTDARRSELRFAAADCAWLAGAASRAFALLNRPAADERPDVRAAIDNLRGHIATRLGPVAEGQRILLEGADRVADTDPDRAVIMLAEAVNAAFYAGDARGMSDAAARIQSLRSRIIGRRSEFFAKIAEGMALIFVGGGDVRGAVLVREAVDLVEQFDELAEDPRLLAWAAMGPLWLRESKGGTALAVRAIATARAQSAVGVLPFLLSHVAVDAVASDRWAEAEAGFHEAIALARETGQRTDLAFALARLGWLEARQGRDESCRSHVTEARALGLELGLGLTGIWCHAALGDLEVAAGHYEAALSHFDEMQQLMRQREIGDVDLSPAPNLVELHLRLGRRPEAQLAFALYEREALAKGQPWALARAARCCGLLAADDQFEPHFEAALLLHEQTPDIFESARSRLAYGARLRRSRRRTLARDQLRTAVEIFDRLGATPWSDLSRIELAATGETARQRTLSTRDDLSPQELQIALLLTSGRTTREAAATMFLSPKTIEYHLRSVYRKLEVNSRDQLAIAMQWAAKQESTPRHGHEVTRG